MANICKVGTLEKDGVETDLVELNPLTDYIASKGVAFEGLDAYAIEKLGKVLLEKAPNRSSRPVYLGNGDLDYVEFFDGMTQTTPNRIAKASLTYSGGNPTTETILIYDPADGATVLRTITSTFTFTGSDLTKVETSTT